MNAIGIIFANLHDRNIPELTRGRTMGSVPFGCRYRLIDFTLSNMVNSGITDIRIATQLNFSSLNDHIGSGKDWDMARRSGGIKVLPPNGSLPQGHSRLDSLKSIHENLEHIDEDYIIMADCDNICNIDFNDVLKDHIAHNAEITMMVRRVTLHGAQDEKFTVITSDENGKITDIARNPSYIEGEYDVALNITVINRETLQTAVREALAHGYTSLTTDIMMKQMSNANYRVYHYDGPFSNIFSLADYFETSMRLISDKPFADGLLAVRERPILTKVRNSAPTRYSDSCKVTDSIIADGCTLEGTVENCILFRGVHIGAGAHVKNCILMQDTYIGANCDIENVVADKNATLTDGTRLVGHATRPFFIEKNQKL